MVGLPHFDGMCIGMLSPVENGGAFRGKIWVKMAAHMRAVR